MIQNEWLFFMQMVMTILMIVFLQKLNQMKKQVDTITKEVMQYISFVTEDVEMEKKDESMAHVSPKNAGNKREDEQNRIIQAVLGEYFP